MWNDRRAEKMQGLKPFGTKRRFKCSKNGKKMGFSPYSCRFHSWNQYPKSKTVGKEKIEVKRTIKDRVSPKIRPPSPTIMH